MLFPMAILTWRPLTAILFSLASIAGARPAVAVQASNPKLKPFQYTYRNIALATTDKSGSHWHVDVGVVNPNPFPVNLERMHFSLLHQRDTLVSEWTRTGKSIPARDSMVVKNTFDLPNQVLKGLPSDVLADPHACFFLVGDAYLKTGRGEFRFLDALRKPIFVNMPEQVKKARRLFFRSLLFSYSRNGIPFPAKA